MKYLLIAFCVVLAACKSGKETSSAKSARQKKKTLISVQMKSLKIEAFPKYDKSGEDWDAYAPFATNPDIYVHITWNKTEVYKSETLNESEFGKPLEFITNLPCELKPFDQELMLEIFDEDGVSSNDNMGYFALNLLKYSDWKVVTLKSADESLSVSLELDWIYK